MKTASVESEKPLPVEFTEKNWHHKEVWRDGDIRIFERWKWSSLYHHWETIRVRHNKARSIGDRQIEASESYPSEKEWGKNGFTFHRFDLALKKAKELSSIQEDSQKQ